MVVKGERADTRATGVIISQRGFVNSAIATIRQKNACPVIACVTATASGRFRRTVIPPSTACTTTSPKAASAVNLTHARRSTIQTHSASVSVRIETVPAIAR